MLQSLFVLGLIMRENWATYTWWDIEDGVGSLATQAVGRWEALGLPKSAAEVPVRLQVRTTGEKVSYIISLFHGELEVYTAEGEIKISGVSQPVVAAVAESTIFEGAADLVGESIAENLTEGLLEWLRQ